MADIVKLSDGTTTLDLALSTDDLQLLVPGSELGISEHDNLMHSSPWSNGERLVRHRLENRKWPLKLLVGNTDSGTPADDLANALNTLARLIRQARRYHLQGDVSRVYLEIQLDGASQWTRYTAVDMETQGASLMEEISRIREDAQLSFTLETESAGWGAQETLANELGNPHFLEGSGTGNEWNDVGTPSSTSLSTTQALVGDQSQKVVTDAAGEGIESNSTGTSGSSRDVVAYAWIYLTTADTVTVSLRNHTDSGDIDTATTTTQDEWVQLTVSGTLPANKAARLRVTATSGATFYVDKCYLQFGTTTAPTAWMSCRYIVTHEDSDAGEICYIDVVDVPGDMEAETIYYLDNNGASREGASKLYMSRMLEGIGVPSYHDVSGTADASRSGGGVGGGSTGTSWVSGETWTIDTFGDWKGDLAVFVVVYDSDAGGSDAVTWRLRYWYGTSANSVTVDTVSSRVRNVYHPLYLGRVPITEDASEFPNTRVQIKVDFKRPSGTDDAYLDFITLLTADPLCVMGGEWNSGNMTWRLYSEDNKAFRGVSYLYNRPSVLGRIPPLYPSKGQRLRIIREGTMPNVYKHLIGDISSDYWKATIYYRPRTEFLLGT